MVTAPTSRFKPRQYPITETGAPLHVTEEFRRVSTNLEQVNHSLDTVSTTLVPFVPSGPGHQQGLVPDPGAVAGTKKFLREDATFTVPPIFVASGASHAAGYAPDPGASAGTTKFLCEDATFKLPPTFLASGASHAVGYVPDPGASAGITRFLREDASWATISNGFTVYRASGGNNDETGINALFASNKTIWLPDPAYKISAAVNIPSNGRLIGMGRGATVITGMASAATINISVANSEMCTLEDFGLTGTMTNAITIGGVGNTNDEILIRCVDIEGPSITNSVNAAGLPYYCRIYDCKFNQVTGSHIVGTGNNTAAFFDLVNVNFGSNNHTQHAISTTNIGFNILNCSVLGMLSDGIVAASTGSPSQPFSMLYSGADSCLGHGLKLTGFGSVLLDAAWVSANSGHGVFLTTCSNVTISSSCRIHYNGKHGVFNSGTVVGEFSGHIVNNGNKWLSAVATANTTTSSATITIGGGVPAGVVAGMFVYNQTTGFGIGTVLSTSPPISPTTITLTANAAAAITAGDVLRVDLNYGGLAFSSTSKSITIHGVTALNGADGPIGNQQFGVILDGTCSIFTIAACQLNGNLTGPWIIGAGSTFINITASTTQVPVQALPPASACINSIIGVYDLTSLTFGATATGGTPLHNGLVTSNGTNWTVIGI